MLIALSLLAARPGSTYKLSFLFLTPLLWLPYFARRRIELHPFHFALFAVALLVHDLGTFGFYRRKFLGLEFDIFVHFYFGIVIGFVLYRAFNHFFGLTGWKLWVAVALFTLGIGGVHELVEWASTMMLGPERGMLKLDPNDPFDTQKDLLNNLCGAILATVLYGIARHARRSEPAHASVPVTSDR